MEPLPGVTCLSLRQVLNNLVGYARATCTRQVWWGNTGEWHRIDLTGVLAPDGSVKLRVCSSVANPAVSYVLVITMNPESFIFSPCHAWQCLPFCPLLAFCQVEMLVPNRGGKEGDNRSTTVVAHVGSPWEQGETATSEELCEVEEVMSWPADGSFLFFTWSRQVAHGTLPAGGLPSSAHPHLCPLWGGQRNVSPSSQGAEE